MNITGDSVVAIIGAGAMGSGIAQVAAQAGHKVILVDSHADALARSRQGIVSGLEKLVARGKMDADGKDAILGRLSWTSDMADVAPAGLVIEAIIENLDIKAGLFAKLGDIVAPDAILASNTSSLSITEMARTVSNPERFVGLHFFNPVPVMKLVEVVPGAHTDARVVDALLELMAQWGKVGVKVRDVPGFIVNRVARPYYAEGFAAWGEGIEPAIIDRALQDCGGFRMGPLALADMIGHDVNYVVARSVYDAYHGKTRFRPQPSQQALYESGALGNKSGKGVYDHKAALPQPVFVTPGDAPVRIEVPTQHSGVAVLVTLAREAGVEVVNAADLPADSIRVGAYVMALGDGRTLSQREGVHVLLDWARDFAKAESWVITSSDDAAAASVAGFAQCLGRKVLRVADRPGQIVLRTMAQLANAAADAVADEVATAADIDAAMRHGANHPQGPLEWTEQAGKRRVAAALSNMAETLGDELYRPAPLLSEGN